MSPSKSFASCVTNVSVVDCSAIAAVAFGEPAASAIRPQLAGRRLVAPALLAFELSQVCTTKIRGHPELRDVLLDQYVAALDGLPIEFAPVGFEAIPQLAARARLSAYDATYLWLAIAHDAPLVTLDNKLAKTYQSLRDSKTRS